MIILLEEMGHPQNKKGVQITTDSITAHGILTSTTQAKLSKAYDMRYHWIKDRIRRKQFQLLWDKGITNLADYFKIFFAQPSFRNEKTLLTSNTSKLGLMVVRVC